jgi:phosphoribosylanthranilate isomerase
MTRVKICGLTREEDALAAAAAGADFLGFVFVRESPRFVAPEVACRIGAAVRRTGSAAKIVGVFRNASIDDVRRVANLAALDLIQFHGEETEEDVRAVTQPVIRAFNVRDALPSTETQAAYVMFDTGGGTGRTFDWRLLSSYEGSRPFFLAGGIRPENVEDAMRARPFSLDVSSGVEHSPGIKNHELLKQLFERVKR